MAYKIVTEPQGRNGEAASSEEGAENKGGMVIYLVKDNDSYNNKQEVERVAFDRSRSKNPRVSFAAQMKKSVEKAITAAQYLNNELMGDGELQ